MEPSSAAPTGSDHVAFAPDALHLGASALDGARRGTDVYLFLIGMTALAEFAQRDGLFDWLAVRAIRFAGRSRWRLFTAVYVAGIGTTALLSNDATVILLTPAVLHALARYDADPLPHALACAFVANAASFVLPISNPSNLLVFAGRMPALGAWLSAFALPALVAIALTYGMLAWRFRGALRGTAARADVADVAPPSRAGTVLLAVAALLLIAVAAVRGPLGATAFAGGTAALALAVARRRGDARAILRALPWWIVPVTALLFALVAALDAAGALAAARAALAWPPLATGAAMALAANAINNLPVALVAGQVLPAVDPLGPPARAVLVGVNLGPNVLAHASLATLLWFGILRRYGIAFRAREFFAVGILVAPPALLAALLIAR